MKKSILALAAGLLVSALPTLVHAEEAASPLTFNVSLTSDYRYRAISQTRLSPTVQGGADYAFANGVYLGTWASGIQWIKNGGGKSNVELDVYGGWKGEVAAGLTLDVGLLQYYYHNNKLNPSANTLEAYGAVSYGPATFKYSHSLTNLFGFADSKNSGYYDLSATFEVAEGLTVTPHVGYQAVKGLDSASYLDYAVTVAKTYGAFVPSLAIIQAKSKAYSSPAGASLADTTAVLTLKYNF